MLEKIKERVSAGKALNEAVRQVVSRSRRSWVMRHWPAYQREGFEALMDQRMPREPRIAMANPRVTVDEILGILRRQKVEVLPSAPTIKQHFSRVDERRRYAEAAKEVVDLPFAGGELRCAAELEAGGIAALTDEVEGVAQEALKASGG